MVVITGKPESVHAAEESIKRTVEERMSEREAGSVTVAVPQHAVGRIIGRQVGLHFLIPLHCCLLILLTWWV